MGYPVSKEYVDNKVSQYAQSDVYMTNIYNDKDNPTQLLSCDGHIYDIEVLDNPGEFSATLYNSRLKEYYNRTAEYVSCLNEYYFWIASGFNTNNIDISVIYNSSNGKLEVNYASEINSTGIEEPIKLHDQTKYYTTTYKLLKDLNPLKGELTNQVLEYESGSNNTVCFKTFKYVSKKAEIKTTDKDQLVLQSDFDKLQERVNKLKEKLSE